MSKDRMNETQKYREVALEKLVSCGVPAEDLQPTELGSPSIELVDGGAWVSCRVFVPEADLEEVQEDG